MNKYLDHLNWRYATKKFDSSKKLSSEEVAQLLEGIQLTASSYGLQPYEVFVISDQEVKTKLKPAAFNQPQITDASHIFVFAGLKKLDENYIDNFLENISKTRNIELSELKGLKNMLHKSILSLPQSDQQLWAKNQAYIALGNFLSAAANLKIDTCPMEGFDTIEFDKILGLPEKNLSTAVIATAGYRSPGDAAQHAAKVRKHKEELFHLI